MTVFKKWIDTHPDLWEFILFNLLSNCSTLTNFIVVWLCTGFLFTPLRNYPFRLFVFDYTNVEVDLGLCGFLSFITATTVAQIVNFFVQKNLVFHSSVRFQRAIPKYILLATVLVLVSAALPSWSQAVFLQLGYPLMWIPTLANLLNILVQVILSYPTMKFWIMSP